jgi:aminomethyltransferase
VANAGSYLFVVVNASMREQDILHMAASLKGIEVTEIFDHALIAVQGPSAEAVVSTHCPQAADMTFMQTLEAPIDGTVCRLSRLGYTGEDGYEISIPEACAERIASLMLSHPDCEPAGLGARDSLRLEAGLCLYGNDIDPTTSPIEAGLTWAIQNRRRTEGGFPGAARIMAELTDGPARKLVGIKPQGRAPAREGVEIHDMAGNIIGKITSGGFGPTVAGPVAMGYISAENSNIGTEIQLIIRSKPQPAEVCALPFVTQNYKR